MIGMGFVASFWAKSVYRYLSFEQVNETIWAVGFRRSHRRDIIGRRWRVAPRPVEGTRIWLFGIGVFAVLLVDMLSKWQIVPTPAHVPPLFGVGGGLIVASFLAILWLWVKKRATLEGPTKNAAHLQLAGYALLFIAMWYLCGNLSRPYQRALSDLPPGSPVSTIVYLVLGWLFLLLSHYKSAKAIRQ